ncbi:uncharacterized protein B0H64DRAFT_409953 [Chaetomium fimeti]|uniref:Uncharacterized protein n=1 Tax=Chaetomium fimeti TaxID=1854472 RepID=A0AAE0H7J8_9PEZI|nr:hypothetical protein B0H64DRAFT_409953 [Chaetomium fimeti]
MRHVLWLSAKMLLALFGGMVELMNGLLVRPWSLPFWILGRQQGEGTRKQRGRGMNGGCPSTSPALATLSRGRL